MPRGRQLEQEIISTNKNCQAVATIISKTGFVGCQVDVFD
jgi:hypothetical protein